MATLKILPPIPGTLAASRFVSTLLTVAVDDRCLARKHASQKDRDDGRVGAVGILARTEDVEVAESDRFEAIRFPERSQVELARDLRGGVGTERRERIGFAFRERRLIAVTGARCGEDDSLHAGSTRLIENDDRAGCGGGVRTDRIVDAGRHGRDRRLMKDHFDLVHRPGNRIGIGDRALQELDVVGDVGQVHEGPRRQVVENADAMPRSDERLGQVRTDEARPSGHQHDSHQTSSSKAFTTIEPTIRAP